VLDRNVHVTSCVLAVYSICLFDLGEVSGGLMLHKISILALLGLAAALLVVSPANADRVPARPTGDLERDADSAPHYWHDVHIDGKLKLNADRFSTFDRDVFKGANSDFMHGLHQFSSGVPNTAEWIWWLNHSDNKEFSTDPVIATQESSTDPVVSTPEPASLFLLGSGMLAFGVWRRRANRSARSLRISGGS
jgi:hypothetical protein